MLVLSYQKFARLATLLQTYTQTQSHTRGFRTTILVLRLPHRFNKLAASCHRLANLVTDLPVLSQDLQSCHGFSSLGTDFLVLSQTYQAFRRLIRLVARLVNIHINTKIYSWNRKEHTLAQVYHKHARLVTNLLGLRPDWRQNFTHRIGTTVFVLKLATNLPSLWVCS